METSEHEQATAQGYDRWAPFYDDTDPTTWVDEPFLLEHLRPFPGCLILDLGCGTGRYLKLLRTATYRIVGMDLSDKMLARARQRITGRANVHLIQASASALPFRASSFDRVMSGLVIDHVASAERLFAGIAAVLTPNVNAVITAVHPHMQRLIGCEIEITASDRNTIRIPGRLHEVDHLLAAARCAGLAIVAMDEPRVTAAMVEHRPAWSRKLGCPALLLLALRKQ
jgi:ubiquinone/menaquinone biosynthesis C-methylase UbiE